jgi:hypothetical protein
MGSGLRLPLPQKRLSQVITQTRKDWQLNDLLKTT